MLGQIFTKVFGSRHIRDAKKMMPIVEEINAFYEEYHGLSDEELRAKTDDFKDRIGERLQEVEAQLEELREEFKREEDHDLKGPLMDQIKEFEEERKRETNAVLDEILPEAFAVVKEVCRRFVGRQWDVCGQTITWNDVPYDVQLIGAFVLHQGKVAEMATGEGKTLVATMPLYLNALSGRGAHLVTPNDYLARRDASWMGPIYDFLGLTLGVIQDKGDYTQPDSFIFVKKGDDYALEPSERKAVYLADITYGNNNEFGFDYLRDNISTSTEDIVQKDYNYAIVDEVDSILIDEARTPHIMSGPVPESTQRYSELKPLIQKLVNSQTRLVNSLLAEAESMLKNGDDDYEVGIKLLQVQRGSPRNKRFMKLIQGEGIKKLINRVEADFMRDKKMGEIDEDLFYSIDEKGHTIDLTDQGRSSLLPEEQDMLVLPDLSENLKEIENDDSLSEDEKVQKQDEAHRAYALRSETIHNISQLLRAYSLFERDVEYVVQEGHVIIVDEFTGRLQPGRRFSDGLHQALEARENVKIERETQTIASITLQNYFRRLYDKLAGMTGTAETEANEFFDIYKLDVAVIPTNEPVRRIDYDDVIYRTKREKYNAIIDEIATMHQNNLPVLVGTISVEVSETLSRMLRRRGIPHSVLNAKYHQKEAEIVAKAGEPGSITIATNMAGRGTDIKLGLRVVKCDKCLVGSGLPGSTPTADGLTLSDCEAEVPCGLQIIGTERHDARRIDRQLRGRSGRQGDPGASRFFLSLEDDLMRLFGSERIASIMDRLGAEENEVIEHSLVTKSISNAQKKVENRNFEMRKHVLEYDDVMNQQREVIYDRRRDALEKEDVVKHIVEMIDQTVESLVEAHTDNRSYPEEWDWDGLKMDLRNIFLIELPTDQEEMPGLKQEDLRERIKSEVMQVYRRREEKIGSERLRQIEKMVLLGVIDDKWREHLYEIDSLKEGIGLRAYGQKDPLVEYKTEAFHMFVDLLDGINTETLKFLFRTPIEERSPMDSIGDPRMRRRRAPEGIRLMHEDATGMGFDVGPDESEIVEQRGGAPVREKAVKQVVRAGPKVGRNDPCICGSGKKYKKCCGRKA